MGARYAPAQTVLPTVVYRRYTPHWRHAAARTRRAAGNQNLIPGPLLRARVGDRIVVHFKNLDVADAAPALDALPRRALHAELGRRLRPGLLGPRRRRHARPELDLPAHARCRPPPASGRTTTTRRSMDESIAGGMYGMLSILGRHERAPDREFVVVFAPMGARSRRSTAAPSSATRRSSRSTRRRARPVGRDGDGLRAPHLPRPRPPLARRRRHAARHRRRSARPRASASAGARRTPARGSTTATSRTTWRPGMIGIYQVKRAMRRRRRAAVAASRRRAAPGRRPAAAQHGADPGGRQADGRAWRSTRHARGTSTCSPATRSRGRTTACARTPSPPTTAASTPAAVGIGDDVHAHVRRDRRLRPTTACCTRASAATSRVHRAAARRARDARRPGPRRTRCAAARPSPAGGAGDDRGRHAARASRPSPRRRVAADGTFVAAVAANRERDLSRRRRRRGEPAGAAARPRPPDRRCRCGAARSGVLLRTTSRRRRAGGHVVLQLCLHEHFGWWPVAAHAPGPRARAARFAPAHPPPGRRAGAAHAARRGDAAGGQPDGARRAGYMSGDFGICVVPLTSGMRIATSST